MTSASRMAQAVRLALGADAAEHRANHAGAGKLSFEVSRGADHLWVRVAADADEDAALQRWAEHATRLAEEYAGPPVLDVLRVEERTTLVFPFLPSVDRRIPPEEVLALLDRLHDDADLADALGPPVTARESFTRLWLERFRVDLEVVEGYVAPDVLAWMITETELLAALLEGHVFDVWVHAPVHGDPWHENIHAGPDRWWLLDWEDLAVGDPVIDEAIVAPGRGGSPRHPVAHRAVMLDAVVDGAADWVENRDPAVRAAKEAAYLAAIEAYEATWG